MSRLSIVAALSAAIATAAVSSALAQEPGTARVSGAEVVNVRQGPGLDHPVIGALRRGQVLEVVGASDGQWIHVRSADIDGHVNRHFLELAPVPQPTTAAAVSPRRSPGQTPPPTATAEPVAVEPAAAGVPPAGSSGTFAGETELQRQIDRILSVTEAMHRDVKMLQTLQVADAPGDGISNLRGGLGLLLLGAVIGFVVGNIFGRRQERGSRSRVRF